MNRTAKSVRNLYVAIIGQIIGIIISFLSRSFFIKYLSTEYLGINGLFTNILQMLSLVELGIGPAIIYTLYKPLADNNQEKVTIIMQLYRKIYMIIGTIIITLGFIITPFISYFIVDMPDIPVNIYIIFILFVFNSGVSYFFSYKRNLIIADQNRYIATIYRYVIYFLLNLTQIIILITTSNYYIYLVLQIIFTIIENILVSHKADKLYPYLKNRKVGKLDIETKQKIIKNTKAMVSHKIGGLVVNSTDNLLLSKIVGVSSVGLYSNYYMITSALNTVISQVFSSVSASVGNVNAIESKEKSLNIFKKLNFINFWIMSFCSISFLCLANNFIELWLGKDLTFKLDIVIILTVCFYLTGMRKSVLTFRDAFGLYWEDRYKPLVEVTINLLSSIYLGYKFGIFGIFLGTVVSTVSTCLWIEPYILYKYGFKSDVKEYFKDYAIYSIFTLIVGTITFSLINLINLNSFLGLVLKAILCLIIPNILIMIIFRKKSEYKYCIQLFIKIINKMLKIKR